jgi:hypothetical protein
LSKNCVMGMTVPGLGNEQSYTSCLCFVSQVPDKRCHNQTDPLPEDGSAGLNGFPCFVECGDKNANLIRAKCPRVFLEIPAHFAPSSSGRSGISLSAADA